MSYTDLQQVHAIEEETFSTPWSINSFRLEMDHKISTAKVASIYNRVIGFICLRTFVDITAVMNIAVITAFRRRGVGSLLVMNALSENARLHPGIRGYILEVRRSNSAAVNLYKKFGFEVTGTRRSYYTAPAEDAVIMGKTASSRNCQRRGITKQP